MIQPGKYRARATGIDDVSFGVSKQGNLQIAVVFDLLDEHVVGQTISWVGTFADGKATDIAIKALEACGWTGEDPTESLDGITDNEVVLVVENETGDDGKVYSKVSWVNRPGAGRVKFKQPISGQDLRVFGADIKRAVAANRAMGGGGQPRQQSVQRPAQNRQQAQRPPEQRGNSFPDDSYGPNGVHDDDLPF